MIAQFCHIRKVQLLVFQSELLFQRENTDILFSVSLGITKKEVQRSFQHK